MTTSQYDEAMKKINEALNTNNVEKIRGVIEPVVKDAVKIKNILDTAIEAKRYISERNLGVLNELITKLVETVPTQGEVTFDRGAEKSLDASWDSDDE